MDADQEVAQKFTPQRHRFKASSKLGDMCKNTEIDSHLLLHSVVIRRNLRKRHTTTLFEEETVFAYVLIWLQNISAFSPFFINFSPAKS